MESDGDHFLTYYLTNDDDAAEQFKDSRADPRGVDALQEEEDVRFLYIAICFSRFLLSGVQVTEFHFVQIVRDYEVVKVSIFSLSSAVRIIVITTGITQCRIAI